MVETTKESGYTGRERHNSRMVGKTEVTRIVRHGGHESSVLPVIRT